MSYNCFNLFVIMREMNLFVLAYIPNNYASVCGCKVLRACYKNMLDELLDRDETACIEDASIGTSTILIFLKALNQFCGEVITVNHNHETIEGRYLYEVIINMNNAQGRGEDKPVIILEAGQQGGTESVELALYVVEQLVACVEYQTLIENVRWVIMPNSNPDGQEYNRYNISPWKKNMRLADDRLGFGVDITRNFDAHWDSCPHPKSIFSPNYPGHEPASENETIFIKDILERYKKNAKVYLSIRRDGHSIMYPYGYTENHPPTVFKLSTVASEVSGRVNQRAGGVHLFLNNSIYDLEGKIRCGHSVDYAFDIGIPLAFEMRVFMESDNRIMTKFQTLPRGYESTLRNAYFSGIRELYNAITNEKKYGKIV